MNAGFAGDEAVSRLEGLAQISDSRQRLIDAQDRIRESYEAATPSRLDRIVDVLGAAGTRASRAGIGGKLRREEAERRRQLDQDLFAVDTTAMELNRRFGADAANAYQNAVNGVNEQKANARSFLATADAAEKKSVVDIANASLTAQTNVRSIINDMERNRLTELRITEENIETAEDNLLNLKLKVFEQRAVVQADVNAMPQFMKLGTGQLSEEEEEILTKQRDTLVEAQSADLERFERMLDRKQLEIEAAKQRMGGLRTPISYTSSEEGSAALASANSGP